MMRTRWLLITVLAAVALPSGVRAEDRISDWKGTTVTLKEGDVMSNGVKIHYHTVGEGPLLIMIHGIGGYWFDWRHQIPELSKHYKVVAMSQRGFNLSDKPVGVEEYSAAKIAGDIDALITHFGQRKAIIMAYDSGGFHARYFAMHYPEKTERLVAIGSFHPATLVREYGTNPAQQKAGLYSRNFQENPNAATDMAKRATDPNTPVRASDTPEIHRMRMEAAKRSSFDAMINFYKANWPRAPYSLNMNAVGGNLTNYPKVKVPTLVVYGREDVPLVVEGLNDLWKWVDQELTLVVVPGAGHGPHAEVPDFTTPRILDWLATRKHPPLQYPKTKESGGRTGGGFQPPTNVPGAEAVRAFVAARMAKGFTPPKTPWGDPHIQGIFTTKDEANTPFERPDEWAGRRMEDITPQEFAAAVAKRQEKAVEDAPFFAGEPERGVAIAVPIHWFDNLAAQNSRPWFVIDPPDGKIPALVAGADARRNSAPGFLSPHRDTYLNRSFGDRCIGGSVWANPGIYGNSYEIVQTPTHVVFRYEGQRTSRMIRLNQPHRSSLIREHYGDSIGWWDGNTLVVETINFPERLGYRGYNASHVRLIERFTRIAPNKVEWSATIEAPEIWSRPWTYSYPMTEDNTQPIFEYACHEGNYGLANLLTAGREMDKKQEGGR